MKNYCYPTATKKQSKRIIKHENVPIGIVYYSPLYFEGENNVCKKIGMFYVRLIENFSKWIDIDFKSYAEKDYLADDNPRKRFRYVPFQVDFDMSCNTEIKNLLQVDIIIKLKKKKKLISEKLLRHYWDLKTGNLHIKK